MFAITDTQERTIARFLSEIELTLRRDTLIDDVFTTCKELDIYFDVNEDRFLFEELPEMMIEQLFAMSRNRGEMSKILGFLSYLLAKISVQVKADGEGFSIKSGVRLLLNDLEMSMLKKARQAADYGCFEDIFRLNLIC